MRHQTLEKRLPRRLHRRILHFEAAIEDALVEIAGRLPQGALILDAGAGECAHAKFFERQRYLAVDLGVGDSSWNYRKLDAIADLAALPFPAGVFDGVINIVTLEHLREPGCALREMERVLKPGGELLLIVPHEWEVHQAPHDYFRYTRHGVAYLLERAGFADATITPVGGYFRLMSRRLFNGLQFFRGIWFVLAALFVAPPALLLPSLDFLDKEQNFTLGYVCTARKRS